MKLPDKIYVHTGLSLGLMQATSIPVNAPDEEEYIRKDAMWEPSEDQLYALFTVVKYAQGDMADTLDRLYGELKELKYGKY